VARAHASIEINRGRARCTDCASTITSAVPARFDEIDGVWIDPRDRQVMVNFLGFVAVSAPALPHLVAAE
jgi:hypothetical protein